MARRWVEEGARYLHVVDLDGAREGAPRNFALVQAIADAVSIPVQTGGGIRDEAGAGSGRGQPGGEGGAGDQRREDEAFLQRALAVLGPARVVVAVDAEAGLREDQGLDGAKRRARAGPGPAPGGQGSARAPLHRHQQGRHDAERRSHRDPRTGRAERSGDHRLGRGHEPGRPTGAQGPGAAGSDRSHSGARPVRGAFLGSGGPGRARCRVHRDRRGAAPAGRGSAAAREGTP